MPQPFRHLRPTTNSSGAAGGISVVVGAVLVRFLTDNVVVAIEMDLELAAVLAGDLDLEGAGAIPVISLDLGDGSATHRRNRGALSLLGVGTRDLLLGVASVSVGDPGAAKGYQHRYRRSYHQCPYVYSVCVQFISSFCLIGYGTQCSG